MFRLHTGQGPQDGRQVMAHGLFRPVGVLGVDRSDDLAMLLDQGEHRFGARQSQETYQIHMRFDVLDGSPGHRTSGARGEGHVEHLVLAPEAVVVALARGLLLRFEKMLDTLARRAIKAFAGPSHNRDLNSLADETCLHHLLH